jgi:hypothetical protein
MKCVSCAQATRTQDCERSNFPQNGERTVDAVYGKSVNEP